MLPQDFLDRMREMLGEEYPAFLESCQAERKQALRINSLKVGREEFLEEASWKLSPVPWADNGFYYEKDAAPGRHPYHDAGLYYVQEPSAMAPAEYLMRPLWEKEEAEAERVLDLCAAPGGKSTQLAAAMHGRGILICNEIHPARAKILSENIERMGVRNALVANETPKRLAERFPSYFTRILVDAPCSGEGMFRKNQEACGEWSLENVASCAKRQDEILDCAAEMLAPGGRLVYSTCTFAPEENEGSISRFLLRHPEFEIERAELCGGMCAGVPEWGAEPLPELARTIRLWPHKIEGEGHYLAVLRRPANDACKEPYRMRREIVEYAGRRSESPCMEYEAFVRETLKGEAAEQLLERYFRFGDQLYQAFLGMPPIEGLKVLRPGLHLGTVKKNRFEPAHALALALTEAQVRSTVNLKADSKELLGYLRGETFPFCGENGWYLVLADGYSIGWGKLAGGIMKNHYPKGLRRQG